MRVCWKSAIKKVCKAECDGICLNVWGDELSRQALPFSLSSSGFALVMGHDDCNYVCGIKRNFYVYQHLDETRDFRILNPHFHAVEFLHGFCMMGFVCHL